MNWVFSIVVSTKTITNEGELSEKINKAWSISVDYYIEDMNKKPFKLSDLGKIIYILSNKYVTSGSMFGISYNEFVKRLKIYKKKNNL